jgi:hypothetical protein
MPGFINPHAGKGQKSKQVGATGMWITVEQRVNKKNTFCSWRSGGPSTIERAATQKGNQTNGNRRKSALF